MVPDSWITLSLSMKMQVIAIQKKTRKSAFAILVKAVLPNPIELFCWFIVTRFYRLFQLVNRLIRDPDEDPTEIPTDGRFLRIPTFSTSPPTVETTPPTPTSSTTDLDGVDPPKRRRTESPRHFRRTTSSKTSPSKVFDKCRVTFEFHKCCNKLTIGPVWRNIQAQNGNISLYVLFIFNETGKIRSQLLIILTVIKFGIFSF